MKLILLLTIIGYCFASSDPQARNYDLFAAPITPNETNHAHLVQEDPLDPDEDPTLNIESNVENGKKN